MNSTHGTLEEIWSARAAITDRCHNNSDELIAYYQERQKVHQDRLVRPEKRYVVQGDATMRDYSPTV